MLRRTAPGRRAFLATAAAAGLLAGLPAGATATPRIEVWKSPTCGCCNDWITHMREAGFEVTIHDTGNGAARSRLGLPAQYGSCHTALVDGYVIEGHVPAGDVLRLLRERPAALGLAVPGMPVGSPGMDGPEYGGRKDPYDTLLVTRQGKASVYAAYR